jgi:hypothetical protein
VTTDRELDVLLAGAAGVHDADLPELPEEFLDLVTADAGLSLVADEPAEGPAHQPALRTVLVHRRRVGHDDVGHRLRQPLPQAVGAPAAAGGVGQAQPGDAEQPRPDLVVRGRQVGPPPPGGREGLGHDVERVLPRRRPPQRVAQHGGARGPVGRLDALLRGHGRVVGGRRRPAHRDHTPSCPARADRYARGDDGHDARPGWGGEAQVTG